MFSGLSSITDFASISNLNQQFQQFTSNLTNLDSLQQDTNDAIDRDTDLNNDKNRKSETTVETTIFYGGSFEKQEDSAHVTFANDYIRNSSVDVESVNAGPTTPVLTPDFVAQDGFENLKTENAKLSAENEILRLKAVEYERLCGELEKSASAFVELHESYKKKCLEITTLQNSCKSLENECRGETTRIKEEADLEVSKVNILLTQMRAESERASKEYSIVIEALHAKDVELAAQDSKYIALTEKTRDLMSRYTDVKSKLSHTEMLLDTKSNEATKLTQCKVCILLKLYSALLGDCIYFRKESSQAICNIV
jgi:hypothetical protein